MAQSYPKHIESAYQEALKVKKKAYAPYSHFNVGACVKFKESNELSLGCNVENACYPAGLCAERTALFSSVALHGKKEIEWIVIVADTKKPTAPCGLCLQVMNEFTSSDFPVYLGNDTQILKEMTFKELLPHGFDTLNDQRS